MEDLVASYLEYLDVHTEAERRRRKLEKIYGTLGGAFAQQLDAGEDLVSDDSDADRLRKKVALWEAIEQVVRASGEIRVCELSDILENLQFKVTRQGVESAIATHKEVFVTRKKDREKYVAIKGL